MPIQKIPLSDVGGHHASIAKRVIRPEFTPIFPEVGIALCMQHEVVNKIFDQRIEINKKMVSEIFNQDLKSSKSLLTELEEKEEKKDDDRA